MTANDHQVGGSHYQATTQHWDIVIEHELNYFEAQILRYVMRCRKKAGLQDLQKAEHFIQKYMEAWPKLNSLPAEVVKVVPRTEQDKDDEYLMQQSASKYFQLDGFTRDGTNYQCVNCRAVVLAQSPLGAAKQHTVPCLLPRVKPASQARFEQLQATMAQQQPAAPPQN